MSLEEQVKAAAEKAVIKFITSGDWLQSPVYAERMRIPSEWMIECWQLVDRQKLQAQIATRLEAELADRIVNHMAAELATDIKQILSVKERREVIRALAREHMDSIMKAGA